MNIHFNIEEQRLVNTFGSNTANLSSVIERLTTGYKVNSAKDDAAMSAVIDKMAVKVSAIEVAESNTNIGIAMLSTAENTLALMQSHVDRIRSLSVQSANEVYSKDQLQAIQSEIDQRLEEINRLQFSTEFNGMNLFCESIDLDGSKVYRVNDISGGVDEVNTPITFSVNSINSFDSDINIKKSSRIADISLISAVDLASPTAITTITAGANKYDVTGIQGVDFDYVYNSSTDTITFTGENVSVVAHDGQNNNIIFDINNGVYVSNNGSTNITVNGDGNVINSNSGTDNIIVNSMADNTLIKGNKNNNLSIINNSSSTKFQGCIGFPESLPDSGSISLTAGQVMDVIIGGKQYSIQNNNSTNSSLSWSLNWSGEIVLNCDNLEIIAANNQVDNLVINGTNNIINTGDLDDIVTNNFGENQIITGSGSDVINLNGGILDSSDVEKINLIGSGKFIANNENVVYVAGGKTYSVRGNNELVSYNKTDINITFNGNNLNIISDNTVAKLNLRVNGDGNSITQSGTNENVTVTGDSNNISAVGGNNRFTINGDNNLFNGSTLKDTVTVDGVGNIVNTNAGNDTVTVSGDSNNIDSGDGNDVIQNMGTNSTINGGAGTDSVSETQVDTNYIGIEQIILENSNGIFHLKAGNSYEFIMGGSAYQITAAQDTTFEYSYSDTAVNIQGSNLNISSTNNSDINLYIVGNDNVIFSGESSNNINIQGNSNKLTTGDGDNNINISGDENTVIGGDGNSYININAGKDNKVNAGEGYDVLINNASGTVLTGVDKLYQIVQNKTLQVGVTSSINSQIDISTGFMLGINSIDISTSQLARIGIKTCDEILAQITDKVLNIGVAQNRLDSALSSLQVQSDNLISSLSTARDADIASESAKFIQYQILQNASYSLLSSTRNIKRESILSLISSI